MLKLWRSKMNQVICLVGPSGVGKSSYAKRLKKHFNLADQQVVTTRNSRVDDGNHYQYVSEVVFQKMIKKNLFLEWDKYINYFYGTTMKSIEDIQNSNYCGCVLDLTPAGCNKVKKKIKEVLIIALLPDNIDWLKKRLFKRNTNSKNEIELRTDLLISFINEVKELKVPIVECRYESSSWGPTFKKIIRLVEKTINV